MKNTFPAIILSYLLAWAIDVHAANVELITDQTLWRAFLVTGAKASTCS